LSTIQLATTPSQVSSRFNRDLEVAPTMRWRLAINTEKRLMSRRQIITDWPAKSAPPQQPPATTAGRAERGLNPCKVTQGSSLKNRYS